MNKFIVMLSGGKDSLACYLKLVEDYGSSNVLPISLSYFYNGNKDRDSTVNAHLTRLTASMNVTIVNGNEKDFSDILDGLFVDIDPTEYYLCTGEIDHFGTDREAYFALQTVTLQCSGYSTFNEDEIQNVLDTIQQNKSIEKSIYQM